MIINVLIKNTIMIYLSKLSKILYTLQIENSVKNGNFLFIYCDKTINLKLIYILNFIICTGVWFIKMETCIIWKGVGGGGVISANWFYNQCKRYKHLRLWSNFKKLWMHLLTDLHSKLQCGSRFMDHIHIHD